MLLGFYPTPALPFPQQPSNPETTLHAGAEKTEAWRGTLRLAQQGRPIERVYGQLCHSLPLSTVGQEAEAPMPASPSPHPTPIVLVAAARPDWTAPNDVGVQY